MLEREKRLPTDRAVRVFYKDEGHRADAVNVSAGGACLSGVGGLPVDATVTISYLHLYIRAEVALSGHCLTGVRFIKPLGPEQLEALKESIAERPGD
jgi:hypothetical protein